MLTRAPAECVLRSLVIKALGTVGSEPTVRAPTSTHAEPLPDPRLSVNRR